MARLLGRAARAGPVAGGVRQRRGPARRWPGSCPTARRAGAGHLAQPGLARHAPPGGVAEFTRAESVALLRGLAAGADARRRRIGWRRRSGICRWRWSRRPALLADTGLTVDAYLRAAGRPGRPAAGPRPRRAVSGVGGGVVGGGVRPARRRRPGRAGAADAGGVAGPEPVPLTLLTDHPDRLPRAAGRRGGRPAGAGRRAAVLHRRGMARVCADSVLLHRVPAALLRARIRDEHAPAGEGWAAMVVRLLRGRVPGDPWNNPAVWPAWQRLLPHVLAAVDPDRRLDTVADESTGCCDRAAVVPADPRRAPGGAAAVPDAPTTCVNRTGSATTTPTPSPRPATSPSTCTRWASTAGARELDEDTLARRRRVLGEDHPDTLTSANNLALDLYALGETRRPGSWTRTPWPAGAGCSATTTPTPSPRPATSPSTCARWVSAAGPGAGRGHPGPPPPGARRRPPRHPHLGQQPRRRPARAG